MFTCGQSIKDLKVSMYFKTNKEVISGPDLVLQASGGYSDLSWTGVCRSSLKPIPIFKGDFGQKGYPFLRIFFQK